MLLKVTRYAQTVAILWDILLGVFGAILLLALLSFVLTTLVGFYQGLLEKYFKTRMRRPDLIPALSRFAAVVTIALLLAVLLIVHFGGET
jgi:fatty acid desaturase